MTSKVTALWILGTAVLAIMATAAIAAAVDNLSRMEDLFDEVGPMRTASYTLTHALDHQHDFVHAFALDTGRPVDLEAYRAWVQRESELIAAIAGSPAVTPDILRHLSNVEDMSYRWRREAAEPAIAARVAGNIDAAQDYLTLDTGVTFEEVASAARALELSITTLRNSTAEAIRSTTTMVLVVNVVGLVVGAALGLVLMLLLQRGVVRPIADLAAQVRRAAAGCPGTEISTTGAPELRLLANDVEAMRRQIAADLAEVEQARQEIEHAHAQLEHQAAELVRSNQDLEQFAYVASHDLREPLRKVSSFCELLQRRYADQLDDRARQYIAYAVAGTRRMQRLIDGLLEFSRVGRVGGATTSGGASTLGGASAFGGMGEAGRPVDLDQVVATQVTHVELGSGDEQAEVTWRALPVVRGDEELIGRLVANVISNGVKFHRPGVPARVILSARRDGAFWEVSCVDNGIGVAAHHAEEVFALFRRLHARGTYPGTGMGLAIARRIVEHHGGRIWIDTTVTTGTAVRFTLPAVAAAPAQTVNDPADAAPAAPTALATASANGSTSD